MGARHEQGGGGVTADKALEHTHMRHRDGVFLFGGEVFGHCSTHARAFAYSFIRTDTHRHTQTERETHTHTAPTKPQTRRDYLFHYAIRWTLEAALMSSLRPLTLVAHGLIHS